MAAYARTLCALTWLRVNHLINGLHKQISCKNCLYAVNSYFTLYIESIHYCIVTSPDTLQVKVLSQLENNSLLDIFMWKYVVVTNYIH